MTATTTPTCSHCHNHASTSSTTTTSPSRKVDQRLHGVKNSGIKKSISIVAANKLLKQTLATVAAAINSVNSGIDENNSKIIFDISNKSLRPIQKKHCSFRIEPDGTQEKFVFEIMKFNKVIRRNESKPFSPGLLKMKSSSVLGNRSFRVTLKKADQDIKLAEYF